MFSQPSEQGTRVILKQDAYLLTWIESFFLDRKAQGLSNGTLVFYQKKLKLFTQFCDEQVISQITEITPSTIRLFLLALEENGHNPGGVHAAYRALRAFLFWWEQEVELDGWNNPIRKVKAPRLRIETLEPISMDIIHRLLDTCISKSFYNSRDKAILLFLLDTGVRAQEGLDIDLTDLQLISGQVLIRHGKGGKPRMVFLGKKSRHVIRSYINIRSDRGYALWVTREGERLSYWGLRQIIQRRAKVADIPPPSIHSFRRAFALNMLRSGVDIYSLQSLMGHAGLDVLRRYLKQTDEDLCLAHQRGSPVDNNRL